MKNALAHSRCALTICVAIAILAGCGGGSGSPIGTTGLPSAQEFVPRAAAPFLTAYFTVKYQGKPRAGVPVTLSLDKYISAGGKLISKGKTNQMGKVTLSKFTKDQVVCYQTKLVVRTTSGVTGGEEKTCWSAGRFPKNTVINF